MFAMTAHKYLSIVYKWQLTDRHVTGMLIVSWLTPLIILAWLPLADSTGTLLGLQASRIYCLIAYDRPETFNFVSAMLVLSFIISTLACLVLSHLHIIIKYRKWTNAGSESDDTMLAEAMKKEAILLRKSIAIVGSFSITWSFYIYQMIYEIATHKQVPAEYDTFWVFLGVNRPILNLVILYIYDAKFNRNIFELFGGYCTSRGTTDLTRQKSGSNSLPKQLQDLPLNDTKLIVDASRLQEKATILLN